MRRSLMTVKVASFTMATLFASLANGHDVAPSPHAHAVQSYDGTHSVNSKPISGRQMRMYRAGAALVPESEQHVLGLINIYNGDSGTRPAVNDPYMNERIGKGTAEGVRLLWVKLPRSSATRMAPPTSQIKVIQQRWHKQHHQTRCMRHSVNGATFNFSRR